MAGKDIIFMSQEDRKRLYLVRKSEEGIITQGEAAEVLGIVERQMRRIVARVREEGDGGVIHKLRGRESNRAYEKEFKNKVLSVYGESYGDFGPAFASEKLEERNKIKIHPETLRLWLGGGSKGLVWQRRGRRHRKLRQRKQYFGMMTQMDGSHHDWLEGRGPWLVLMGYIDDATGEVYARFYMYEGTIPAMDSFKRYIRKYGLPQSVYFDRHTTYKSTQKPSVEDELLNRKALSQFGRALRELGVDFIHAHSPQAKGRVERLFRTFQDRLVKELRLAGIKTMEEANIFLVGYLPKFNKQFNVIAMEKGDIHRKVPKGIDIDGILCIKAKRTLRNDFTVMYEKKLYQVLNHTRALKVIVEEHLNGKLHITYEGKRLKYREIPAEWITGSKKLKQAVVKQKKITRARVDPKDHPWRQAARRTYETAQWLKEKETKRNERNRLNSAVDTAAHVEIGGQPQTAGGDHNSHNRLDNPRGLSTVPTTRRLGVLIKRKKPDISKLVKIGHF